MGWGLMWLLVADARGKRKGGEKAFSTNRFHCQRWIIALLHTHFLTFYCWHWMANFPFAECLKISQNCEILPMILFERFSNTVAAAVCHENFGVQWKERKSGYFQRMMAFISLAIAITFSFEKESFLWLASVPAIPSQLGSPKSPRLQASKWRRNDSFLFM